MNPQKPLAAFAALVLTAGACAAWAQGAHRVGPDELPDYWVLDATASDASVMGFRHRELPIHGVQFHPESIATEHGHALIGNFLKLCGVNVTEFA